MNMRKGISLNISIYLLGLALFGYDPIARAEFVNVSDFVGLNNSIKLAFGNPTWVDFDNDGHLDLLYGHHSHQPNLYANNGDGTFTDITEQSGLIQAPPFDHHGFALGDYNNDGYIDLFIAEGYGVFSKLYKGDGNGHFTYVSTEAGIDKGGRTANWVDYNNDGYLDVLLQQEQAVILYSNNGDNFFWDMANEAGLGDLTSWTNVGSFADYDNDGNADLFLRSDGDRLFNNNGDGTFTEDSINNELGIAKGIAWGDYDNDGDLDLYIARGTSNFYGSLYWDESAIVFTDIMNSTQDLGGLDFTTTGSEVKFTLILQQNWSTSNIFIGSEKINPSTNNFVLDNAPGTPDIVPGVDHGFFIWKDENSNTWHLRWSTAVAMRNFFGRISSLDNGEFTDVIPSYNVLGYDFKNTLYRNDGDRFTDVTEETGVEHLGNHYGAIWGDYNNDGYIDLYVVDNGNIWPPRENLLYHNNGDGTFTEQAFEEGVDAINVTGRGYGAAWGDYDNDGFLDLSLSNGFGWGYPYALGEETLYKNLGNENHWLKLNLIGVMSNRSALGSRIQIESNGITQYRQLNGGGGGELYGQGSGPIHFGLGSNTIVEHMVISWPSGIIQEIENIPADQILHVIESEGISNLSPQQPAPPPVIDSSSPNDIGGAASFYTLALLSFLPGFRITRRKR